MEHLTEHLPNLPSLDHAIAGLSAGVAAAVTMFKNASTPMKALVCVGGFVLVVTFLSIIT